MFNKEKIEELYPQAGELMWEPQLVWSLPAGKEEKLEEMCENGEYFASIKKDGACYQYVKTEDHAYLFGRTVSKVTGLLTEKGANVPHILSALDCLPTYTVIVFEIYYPGGTSKNVTSIMGCLPQKAIDRQKDNPIHAYAHDILHYNGEDLRTVPAFDRYQILEKVWKDHELSQYDFLELAQPIYDNILEETNKILSSGEEGVVLRRYDGAWYCGKRPAWNTIKIKQHDTIDLVCMGFVSPTKEYTGKELDTWPYWMPDSDMAGTFQFSDGNSSIQFETKCIPVTKYYYYGWPSAIKIGAYNENNELVELGTVSSGLSDDDKQGMAERPDDYLMKVVTLDCMSIDKKEKTLRHPVFRCWRDDKNAKDCTIIEAFK